MKTEEKQTKLNSTVDDTDNDDDNDDDEDDDSDNDESQEPTCAYSLTLEMAGIAATYTPTCLFAPAMSSIVYEMIKQQFIVLFYMLLPLPQLQQEQQNAI